jgi:hypothetical protein
MRRILSIALCLSAATPAYAQSGMFQADQDQAADDHGEQRLQIPPTKAGHIASSSVGEVGQRQTRQQAPDSIAVGTRVAARIQNRVQSRIRNRIDRNYDPQSNATSPFAVAQDQARTAGRPKR